mgnify:CR=1 FL=1
MNSTIKFSVNFTVPRIETIVADHFKMFLRDMPDQTFDEVHNRDRFLYIFIIFVSIVMKSDHRTIIFVDPGSGDHRTPQIASDIFDGSLRITRGRLGINVKSLLMRRITEGFDLFERIAQPLVHLIKESGTESRT